MDAPQCTPRRSHGGGSCLTCFETSLVISNMLTCALPPNTGFSVSSDLIIRLFFLSWRPFFLMYAHSFLVISVRGIGFEPTTSLNAALGCTGFMNAAFGFRLLAAFFAMSSPCEGARSWTPPGRRLRRIMNNFPLKYQRETRKNELFLSESHSIRPAP